MAPEKSLRLFSDADGSPPHPDRHPRQLPELPDPIPRKADVAIPRWKGLESPDRKVGGNPGPSIRRMTIQELLKGTPQQLARSLPSI